MWTCGQGLQSWLGPWSFVVASSCVVLGSFTELQSRDNFKKPGSLPQSQPLHRTQSGPCCVSPVFVSWPSLYRDCSPVSAASTSSGLLPLHLCKVQRHQPLCKELGTVLFSCGLLLASQTLLLSPRQNLLGCPLIHQINHIVETVHGAPEPPSVHARPLAVIIGAVRLTVGPAKVLGSFPPSHHMPVECSDHHK